MTQFSIFLHGVLGPTGFQVWLQEPEEGTGFALAAVQHQPEASSLALHLQTLFLCLEHINGFWKSSKLSIQEKQGITSSESML